MRRTLLAAVIGGLITMGAGVFSAQAAPISVPNTTQVGTSLVQTTGYGYRRHHHVRRYHRPIVRWHGHRTWRHRYVRPHYGYARPHTRYWTHRYHRRHYH